MSPFSAELRVELVTDKHGRSILREGRQQWRLLAPFRYRDVVAPEGFVTDFCSIPRLLWRIEPPVGIAARAAIPHDWLYQEKAKPRDVADGIFRDALRDLGIPRWKAQLMYVGVRLGGASGYGRVSPAPTTE